VPTSVQQSIEFRSACPATAVVMGRTLNESRDQQTKCGSRRRQFSLTSTREAQRIVVRACGRLVLGHGAHDPFWASHMDEPSATDVALDLSCVNDVDARGLGVLADLARRRGTRLSVLAASRVVQRLGEMTRLDRALPGDWHERIGVLSYDTAGATQTILHATVRELGSSGCNQSPAAA
jgi:ABC-type transporter Mla MlaB component